MLAQALEYIVGRHVRSGIRQRFLDALSQPIVERGIFPVECPHGRPENLAYRGISPGLDPRIDTLLKFAEGDGNRTALAGHDRAHAQTAVNYIVIHLCCASLRVPPYPPPPVRNTRCAIDQRCTSEGPS